ncbi:MAG: hypothetical protein JWR69_4633 [Pedosphaera sp.]|nr:hypothetical protein [Pedosphaera sp.]
MAHSLDSFWIDLARRKEAAIGALPVVKIQNGGHWPSWRYPWEGIEANSLWDSGGITLAAYGSLMNEASAAATLAPRPARTRQPALALGVQRVYDYVMPTAALRRYQVSPDGDERAALNAYVTGVRDDVINATLVSLTIEDIPALRAREVDYDLTPVPVLPGANPAASVAFAYLLTAPGGGGAARRDESSRANNLMPVRPYHALVCEACSRVSDAWLELFLATTRLRNGQVVGPVLHP